jgi:hypothetical protein
MHSARNGATAVAGAEETSLVLPAICKNLLATTHTKTHTSYEKEEEERKSNSKFQQ